MSQKKRIAKLVAAKMFLTLHMDWHGNWSAQLVKQGVGVVGETGWEPSISKAIEAACTLAWPEPDVTR